jgi:hypothetical protein
MRIRDRDEMIRRRIGVNLDRLASIKPKTEMIGRLVIDTQHFSRHSAVAEVRLGRCG